MRIFERIEVFIANRSWEGKRNYLIKKGAKIGEKTRFNCKVDSLGSEPYLVNIGEDCLIADKVNFITHDGGVKVLNSLNYFQGEELDNIAPIFIGNNVYIGMGAFIMPGVRIGDNCIIGANAVVTHDIPSDSVAVGMPAKVIESVSEYYSHNLEKNRFYPTGELSPEEKRDYFSKIRFE